MRYEIRHYRYFPDPFRRDYMLIGKANTLQQAKSMRAVSGDLVFDTETDTLSVDQQWLWEWEIVSLSNYALLSLNVQRKEISDECIAR